MESYGHKNPKGIGANTLCMQVAFISSITGLPKGTCKNKFEKFRAHLDKGRLAPDVGLCPETARECKQNASDKNVPGSGCSADWKAQV